MKIIFGHNKLITFHCKVTAAATQLNRQPATMLILDVSNDPFVKIVIV